MGALQDAPQGSHLATVDGKDAKDAKTPRPSSAPAKRIDRTRAIVLRIEDNTAVLINDFETNHARVEFGPAKVMLRLNLFDSMQGLLGPGLKNGAGKDGGVSAAS